MKLSLKLILLLVFTSNSITAQINRYSKPAENNLQQREESSVETGLLSLALESEKNRKIALSYKEYYKSIESFKPINDGTYKAVLIMEDSFKGEGLVTIYDNKVFKLLLKSTYDSSNGLHVNSKPNNAHSKVFLEIDGQMIPVDVYIPEFFK